MAHDRSALKVGLLIIAALGALGAALLLIGERKNLFVRNEHYTVRFQTVNGLRAGSPVQLNGVSVGEIEHVELPVDIGEKLLTVRVRVDRRYRQRIREDSVARIRTIGLLGDKYIEISSGSPTSPEVPSAGEIPAAAATNVDQLMASGEDVVANVVAISHSLSKVLERMERGEGVLGELTQEQAPGRRLTVEAMNTLAAVRGVAASIDSGKGPLPRLLHDAELAARLDRAITRLDMVLADLQQGPGLLPALLHDEPIKAKLERTLDSLDRAAHDLSTSAGNLQRGEAMLPRLLHDEAYGREMTDELRNLVKILRAVADKLDRGDGTAARLLNDPAVYQGIQDVLVGIDESRLLRWLIRNRQKAGIAKRYEDAQRASPPAPTAGVPPPPAASAPPEPEADGTTPPPSAGASHPAPPLAARPGGDLR